MFYFLPTAVRGSLSFLMYLVNTVFFCILLFIAALFKLLLPVKPVRIVIDRILVFIAACWISVNSLNARLFSKTELDIRGLEKLNRKEWYLVLSNHQSWVDILVLQRCLNQQIPMLKFFLKKELIWVPFLGLAWWALDFPFMKRYSKSVVAKKPHLKGKDLERTRKACRKFKDMPVSVMNFIEGTRFSPEKRDAQNSPYRNLLIPRAGGIAFVLSAMGDCLHKIINVTIVYHGPVPTFWQYISGQVKKITIDFELMPINSALVGDYFNDPEFKARFYDWLNKLWEEKDRKIDDLKKNAGITCS